jgi:hypothetical protein
VKDKAVVPGAVGIASADNSIVVDTDGEGGGSARIINRAVSPALQEETMLYTALVVVHADERLVNVDGVRERLGRAGIYDVLRGSVAEEIPSPG